MRLIFKIYFIAALLFFINGCAYYNIFFNAEESYRLAREKHINEKSGKLPAEAKNNYNRAIQKSWKLLDFYGDSSAYADDALILIGKSHYFLAEYIKAERVFQQFLLKFKTSEFVSEAKLYLARTYIELEKDEMALEELDQMIKKDVSDDLAAESYRILGDLYFKREQYETAITNLQNSAELTSDDTERGRALYAIGDSYYIMGQYQIAINHYDLITKLDVPVMLEFEAVMQKVEALLQLKEYEEAELELKDLFSDIRFKAQFSQIETKLANIFEHQNEIDFASSGYYSVIQRYPKSEGAALAAFYLGQIYEYETGQYDSAKAYYDKVPKIFRTSEAVVESKQRAVLLGEYLKIRDQLRKDYKDIYKLTRGDSVLIDSVVIDSSEQAEESQASIKDSNDIDQSDTQKDIESFQSSADSTQNFSDNQQKSKPKPKKKAVSRSPEQVESSLLKNSFAIGEFFLIKYQNLDSALIRYRNFAENFEDSLLTPKAYYSVYYLYKTYYNDSLRADSIKSIILDTYPNSVYSEKLSGLKLSAAPQDTTDLYLSVLKSKYHEAEKLINLYKYRDALEKLNEIIEIDSSNVWAQKSQYAISYVYEHYLHDTTLAIESYTTIVENYPNSDYAKIAKNKIKKPVVTDSTKLPEPETITQDTTKTDSVQTAPLQQKVDKKTEKDNPVLDEREQIKLPGGDRKLPSEPQEKEIIQEITEPETSQNKKLDEEN